MSGEATLGVVRERLALLGHPGPPVHARGREVVVELERKPGPALADALAGRGRLVFYDWEPNVLGRDGRPAPRDPQVTGALTGAGGPASALPREEARRIARKASRRMPVRVLRADTPDHVPPANRWYVLADRPLLTGKDIVDPELGWDNGPGGSGAPVVTFGFTEDARRRWHADTRRIARRGARALTPGMDPLSAAQHFAIALDDQLISVPYIDFVQNPNGVNGVNGSQIEGGFTKDTARALVAQLKTPPLPQPLQVVDDGTA